MAKGFNQITLVGHVGQTAETRHTPSGKPVTNFSFATNRWVRQEGGQGHEAVDWHRIVLWDAEKLAAYLTKGTPATIIGRMTYRKYEKDGIERQSAEVVAQQVILQGSGGQGGRHQQTGGQQHTQGPAPDTSQQNSTPPGNNYDGPPITDDDVPF